MQTQPTQIVAWCLIAVTLVGQGACGVRAHHERSRELAGEPGLAGADSEPSPGPDQSGGDAAGEGGKGGGAVHEAAGDAGEMATGGQGVAGAPRDGGTAGEAAGAAGAQSDAGAASSGDGGGPRPCVEGTIDCGNAGAVLRCVNENWVVVRDCRGLACAPNYVNCVARTRCTPGETRCRGSVAEVCMPSGVGFDKLMDCQASGLACKAGSCVDGPCEPVDEVCGADGMYSRDGCGHLTLANCCDCGFLDYDDIEPIPFCISLYRPLGKPVCEGDAVYVCGVDNAPVPCDGNSYCEKGVCKPRPCQVGESYCDGDQIILCASPGPPRTATQCDQEGAACVAEGGHASCRRWWCRPGESGCIDNQGGECAADGRSLTSVTSDCAASGQICDSQGRCAASVMESIGRDQPPTTTFANDRIYSNELEIFSSRVLTEISARLHLPTERDLVWQVYELDPKTSGATLRCEVTSSTPAVWDEFVSSGPLDCPLERGKHYALTLRDTAPDSEYGTIGIANSDPLGWTYLTSFAHWVGSNETDLVDFQPPLVLSTGGGLGPFAMKLTTKAP